MSAAVLPMPETEATRRRVAAYYVLAALHPDMFTSGEDFATVRSADADRIEAALHAAEQCGPDYAKARAFVDEVMAQDALSALTRRLRGGF